MHCVAERARRPPGVAEAYTGTPGDPTPPRFRRTDPRRAGDVLPGGQESFGVSPKNFSAASHPGPGVLVPEVS